MTQKEKKGINEEELSDFLHGNTFKVYWVLLSEGEVGIRELQRNLDFSSPNVASHHLKKLVNAGLVFQNPSSGKYEIKREVKAGVLSLYTRFGRYLVPQNLFLLTFFFSMTIFYILLVLMPRGSLQTGDFLFFSLSFTGILFLIQNTQKIWRLRPI